MSDNDQDFFRVALLDAVMFLVLIGLALTVHLIWQVVVKHLFYEVTTPQSLIRNDVVLCNKRNIRYGHIPALNDFDHTSPDVLAMSCSASYSTKKISFFYDQRETVGSLFCFLKGPLKSCRRCAIHVSVFVVSFFPLYFYPKTFVCYFFNVRKKKKLGKTLKEKPTQNREIVFLVQKPRH